MQYGVQSALVEECALQVPKCNLGQNKELELGHLIHKPFDLTGQNHDFQLRDLTLNFD